MDKVFDILPDRASFDAAIVWEQKESCPRFVWAILFSFGRAKRCAIVDQMSPKKSFESVAKQRFQNFSWFGFERKSL